MSIGTSISELSIIVSIIIEIEDDLYKSSVKSFPSEKTLASKFKFSTAFFNKSSDFNNSMYLDKSSSFLFPNASVPKLLQLYLLQLFELFLRIQILVLYTLSKKKRL